MKRQAILALTIILLGHLSSCREDIKSSYKTYNDIVESGYFENGWIPKIIPTDSKDIEEIHDLDNNRVYGQFRFHNEFKIDSITEKINIEKIISDIESINRPSRPAWFPTDKELRMMNTINIRHDGFYILFDNENKRGYFIMCGNERPTMCISHGGASVLIVV